MSYLPLHVIKNEIKENLSISVPLIASQLIYSCSGFIATAFVARLGEDALAASVLVSMIWMSLSMLFFGVLNSISVLVSHQYGAKNKEAISEIMGQSFILGVAVTAAIIVMMNSIPFFLKLTTQPPEVTRLAIVYMKALLWQIPGLVLLIIYEQFLAGINRTKIVLRISLLVVPVEIPIIYVLIFGRLGMPACGVAGIGYGFAITYTATAIGMTIYFLYAKIYRQYGIFKGWRRINLRWLKELARIGLPMGLMHVIEVTGFTIMTFWIARFGTIFLAAHQIVMQYLGFMITIAFAMSQGLTVRVGHGVGRCDLEGLRLTVYIGILLNFLCSFAILLVFNLFPGVLLQLDINVYTISNQPLVQAASTLLSIASLLLFFDSFRIIGFGALRGLKDTKFPMYASFIGFGLVGLSLAFIFGFPLQGKAFGIWEGMTMGILIGALIVYIRLFRTLKTIDKQRILDLNRLAE